MHKAYALVFLFLLTGGVFLLPHPVQAEWVIDRNGHINFYMRGSVLGDSSDKLDDSSSGKGKNGTQRDDTNEEEADSLNTPSATPEDVSEDNSGKTQSNSSFLQSSSPKETSNPVSGMFGLSEKDLDSIDSLDAATKKADVHSSDLESESKIEIEQKDGSLHISSSGSEDTLDDLVIDEDVLTLEDKLGKDQIKIATASGNALVLFKSDVGARTFLPVSVNLQTNSLSVTTSQGAKTIEMFPDQAVEALQKNGVVDRIEASNPVFGSSELKSVPSIFSLEMENGMLVYRMHGVKNKKLLWLFPVTIEKELTVSASNGAVLKTDKSFVNKVLDKISF